MKYFYAFLLSIAFLFSNVQHTYAADGLKPSQERQWEESTFKKQVDAIKRQENASENKNKAIKEVVYFFSKLENFFLILGLLIGVSSIIYQLLSYSTNYGTKTKNNYLLGVLVGACIMNINSVIQILTKTIFGIDYSKCNSGNFDICYNYSGGFLGLKNYIPENSPILQENFVNIASGILTCLTILGTVTIFYCLWKLYQYALGSSELPKMFIARILASIVLANIYPFLTAFISFLFWFVKNLGI